MRILMAGVCTCKSQSLVQKAGSTVMNEPEKATGLGAVDTAERVNDFETHGVCI